MLFFGFRAFDVFRVCKVAREAAGEAAGEAAVWRSVETFGSEELTCCQPPGVSSRANRKKAALLLLQRSLSADDLPCSFNVNPPWSSPLFLLLLLLRPAAGRLLEWEAEALAALACAAGKSVTGSHTGCWNLSSYFGGREWPSLSTVAAWTRAAAAAAVACAFWPPGSALFSRPTLVRFWPSAPSPVDLLRVVIAGSEYDRNAALACHNYESSECATARQHK